MQRKFNCDEIRDTCLTAVNSLIYESPICVIIYTSYKLLKMVRFCVPFCVYVVKMLYFAHFIRRPLP